MRPSSSSNLNAPDRATSPMFIDFFAKEAAEHQERIASIGQQGPLTELSPRHRAGTIADVGPSANLPVTISTLRNFLSSKGHPIGQHIYDATIQSRLIAANLSTETLLTALEITHTPNHPLLKTLGLNKTECLRLINKLKGIVNHSAGFSSKVIDAAQRSNNNPNQLIINFLPLVR